MIRERRLIRSLAAGRKPGGSYAVRALGLAGVLAAAGALSGCISDPFNQPTDPKAQGAAEISQVAATPGNYPHWSNFPAAPTNVPTVAMWNTEAKAADADQAQLLREAAGLQWTLDNTDAWAAEQRLLINPAFAVPAPADSEASTADFAAKAHALAVPPPPVK